MECFGYSGHEIHITHLEEAMVQRSGQSHYLDSLGLWYGHVIPLGHLDIRHIKGLNKYYQILIYPHLVGNHSYIFVVLEIIQGMKGPTYVLRPLHQIPDELRATAGVSSG